MPKLRRTSMVVNFLVIFSPLLAHAAEPGPYAILTGLFGSLIITFGPFILLVTGIMIILSLKRIPTGTPGKLKKVGIASVFLLAAVLALGFRVLTWYAPYLALAYDKVYLGVYYGLPFFAIILIGIFVIRRMKSTASDKVCDKQIQEPGTLNTRKSAISTPVICVASVGVVLIISLLWFRFEQNQNRRIEEQYKRDHPSVEVLNQQAAVDLAKMKQNLERYQKTGELPKEEKQQNITNSSRANRMTLDADSDMQREVGTLTDKALPPDDVLANEFAKELRGTQDFGKINELAKNAFQVKNYRKAASIWAWLISQDPSTAKYYINMAMALNRLDQHDRAETQIIKGLSMTPKNGWAFHTYAGILYSKQNYIGAARASRHALIYGYDNVDSRFRLACSLGGSYWQEIEQNKVDSNCKEMKALRREAVSEFRKLHSTNPNYFGTYENDIRTYRIILRQDLDKPVWLMFFGI